MNIKDLQEYIEKNKIDDNASLIIHTNTGNYEVSNFEFDNQDNILKVGTFDDIRSKMYRISYRITKDHRIYSINTIRKAAHCDMDIICEIDTLSTEFLKNEGINGEISDKTGSTIIVETEMVPYVDDQNKLAYKEHETKHYYNCEILEVFRELDDETDTYIRIWKNGNIG